MKRGTSRGASRRPTHPTRPIRVVHPITKLAVGGAQESVLVTCAGLSDREFIQTIVTGPEVDEEGALFEAADDLGIDVVICPPMGRAVRPLHDLRSVWWLARWFRRYRPDVVHTHSSKAGFLGRAAATLARVPVVVHSVHGWSFHDEMSPVLRRVVVAAERVAAVFTTRLIIEGRPDLGKGLAEHIGNERKYLLIRNGIDVAAFKPDPAAGEAVRAELGLPADARVIGTVGRLADQKHPLAMVEAFVEVRATGDDDVYFVWIGDGPLRGDVEAAIARHGLEERFLLPGVRRDVPRVLNAFDIFALSSLWEGLPRTVTEAMATGVPVVGTAVDGVAEVIDDGSTGLLAPPRDPAALARQLRRVLDDPQLADALRAAGHDRAWEFDRQEMVRRLDRLYRLLLADHG